MEARVRTGRWVPLFQFVELFAQPHGRRLLDRHPHIERVPDAGDRYAPPLDGGQAAKLVLQAIEDPAQFPAPTVQPTREHCTRIGHASVFGRRAVTSVAYPFCQLSDGVVQ